MRITRVLTKELQGVLNNTDLRELNLTDADKKFFAHKPFVMSWQRAENPAEVAKKHNMTQKAVIQKANWLRKWIPLKRFNHRLDPETIARLSVLAKELCSNTEPLDYEEIVRTWETAPSPRSAAAQLGIPGRKLTEIIANLRRHIPELRRFKSERNMPALKKLVKDLQAARTRGMD